MLYVKVLFKIIIDPDISCHADLHDVYRCNISNISLSISLYAISTYDTFDDDFKVNPNFTKYLKMRCGFNLYQVFCGKYFSDFCSGQEDVTKAVKTFLVTPA